MTDEGNKDVDDVKPDKDGKYPETVPWGKYVAIKESLGGKLTAERTKVSGLEEKLKSAVSTDEHNKVKQELEQTKADAKKATDDLSAVKEKSLSEKRATLTKRGIPEDKVKDMSDKELDAAMIVLQHSKPGPDMGGGGGAGPLTGKSPMELAQLAYSKK